MGIRADLEDVANDRERVRAWGSLGDRHGLKYDARMRMKVQVMNSRTYSSNDGRSIKIKGIV